MPVALALPRRRGFLARRPALVSLQTGESRQTTVGLTRSLDGTEEGLLLHAHRHVVPSVLPCKMGEAGSDDVGRSGACPG